MTERTLLANMLWELKESGDGLSYSKMAARSDGLVATSTLHGVMSGKAKELTPDTINGLAKILHISTGEVLAALNNEKLSADELESLDKERLWEMYSDIPTQCQKDVMDLLEVLQRNHSVSARRQSRFVRRAAVASTTQTTSLSAVSAHDEEAGKGNTHFAMNESSKQTTTGNSAEELKRQRGDSAEADPPAESEEVTVTDVPPRYDEVPQHEVDESPPMRRSNGN